MQCRFAANNLLTSRQTSCLYLQAPLFVIQTPPRRPLKRSGKQKMMKTTNHSARPHAAVLTFLGLASLPLGTAAATEIDCYSGNGATYNGTRSRTATGAGAAQTTPAHSRMPAVHAVRVARRSVEIRLCRCTRCCRHGVHGMGAQQAPRRGAHAGPLAVRPLGAVAEQPALELLP